MPEGFETRYEKFESFLIRFLYNVSLLVSLLELECWGKGESLAKPCLFSNCFNLFLFDCLANCVGHSGESAVCVSRRSVGVNQGETNVWQPLV